MHSLSIDTIDKYILSKKNSWAETTKSTARAKLVSIFRLQCAKPVELFNELLKLDHTMYTIRVYFQIWRDFERFCYGGKSPTDVFLKNNRLLFRNAYQNKTYLLTQKEYENLLDEAALKHKGLFNMLILMGCSGLRLSETLEAKWEDIDSMGMLRVSGKGRKIRLVPIPREKFFEIPGPLICGAKPPYRKFFSDKTCTPHDLRAFFATTISETMTIDELMDLLGHSNFSTALRYIRRNPKVIKEKMNDHFKKFQGADRSVDRSDQEKCEGR